MLRFTRLRLAFAGAVLVASIPAEAQEASEAKSMHRSPHTEESRWLVGAKAVQLSAFEDGESEFGGGAGVFVETTVIRGWMELELTASFVGLQEGIFVVPFELLAKKPFHFGNFCPYLAIGPTVEVVSQEGTEVLFGGAVVVGGYYFFSESVGLDVEVGYGLLAGGEHPVHELALAAGPLVRF